MMRKLLALLVLNILVVVGALSGQTRAPANVPDPAEQVVLAPQQIGQYQRTEHWHNPWTRGSIEEGGTYVAAGKPVGSLMPTGAALADVAVQLDFFRHAATAHNGLRCYIQQGETLRWQRLETITTASGQAHFLVALAQTQDTIRLVATTECSAAGCRETLLNNGWRFSWFDWFNGVSEEPVVPVSIVLTVPEEGRDITAVQEQLLSQFRSFAALVDMAAARRVAALQTGVEQAR